MATGLSVRPSALLPSSSFKQPWLPRRESFHLQQKKGKELNKERTTDPFIKTSFSRSLSSGLRLSLISHALNERRQCGLCELEKRESNNGRATFKVRSSREEAGGGRKEELQEGKIIGSMSTAEEQREPWLVRVTVDALTEGLRLLGVGRLPAVEKVAEEAVFAANILEAIRADYEERAYFLTGNITDSIYAEDCYFGDPTVKFTGRERWKSNIQLLVPFFLEPSIELKDIQRVDEEDRSSLVVTQWRLRTYLRFPWRPLIDINGSTVHTLDASKVKVVRHVESWEVSGVAAIAQMFVPSSKAVWPPRKS